MLLLLTGLFVGSISFSQLQAGQYVIGGSSNFNYYKSSNASSTNNFIFGVTPTFGKFLTDKLLLEGTLGYEINFSQTDHSSNLIQRNISHNITGGIALTRYFSIVDKFYVTLGGYLNAGFGPSKLSTISGGVKTSTSDFNVSSGVGVTPGLAILLNDRWLAFTNFGSLGYSLNYNDGTGISTHSLGYSLKTNPISIGVKYILK